MKIHSIFQACEGEGKEVGIMKTFIRTQGCSIGCKNCDSPQARSFKEGKHVDIPVILKAVGDLKWKRVTITGGEPLEQPDIVQLCRALKKEKYFITLETSGQIFNKEAFSYCDFLSVDAKTPSTHVGIDWEVHRKILKTYGEKTQIKGIVETLEDYKFLKSYYTRFLKEELLLQPYQLVITPGWKYGQKSFDRDFVIHLLSLVMRDKLAVRLIIQQHKLIYGSELEDV